MPVIHAHELAEPVPPCEFKALKDSAKDVIDWPSMIDALEHHRYNNSAAWYDLHAKAVRASKSWVTCACGNLCWRIARAKDGCPIDAPLARLGRAFFGYIRTCNWRGARQALADIELRSMEILHIMKNG